MSVLEKGYLENVHLKVESVARNVLSLIVLYVYVCIQNLVTKWIYYIYEEE